MFIFHLIAVYLGKVYRASTFFEWYRLLGDAILGRITTSQPSRKCGNTEET